MSNFLNLIRTIFKLSGSQAFPTNENRIVLTNSQTNGSYTAPSDGYFCVYSNSTGTGFCDVYSEISDALAWRITSLCYSFGVAGSGTIPVKKGNIVKWQSDVAIKEIWFVPSTGSQ